VLGPSRYTVHGVRTSLGKPAAKTSEQHTIVSSSLSICDLRAEELLKICIGECEQENLQGDTRLVIHLCPACRWLHSPQPVTPQREWYVTVEPNGRTHKRWPRERRAHPRLVWGISNISLRCRLSFDRINDTGYMKACSFV
jgi:hypothetical protein